MKMVDIEEENHQNFNEIFRKDVTYDRIKNKKNQNFTFSLRKIFLEKPQWETNSSSLLLPPPHLFRVKT